MDNNYLQRRAQELNLGREGTLQNIQTWLDQQYPGRCRALSLNDGVLKVATAESAVASDLRMRQVEVLQRFVTDGVTKFVISIKGL